MDGFFKISVIFSCICMVIAGAVAVETSVSTEKGVNATDTAATVTLPSSSAVSPPSKSPVVGDDDNISTIPNAELNGTCSVSNYEKYSVVHLTRKEDQTATDYKVYFKDMIRRIKDGTVTAADVCFHKKMHLSCIHDKCHCANVGRWKRLKYVVEGDNCVVGKGGVCNVLTNKANSGYLQCKTNLNCVPSGRIYVDKRRKFICSSSTRPNINSILQLLTIFVLTSVALLLE